MLVYIIYVALGNQLTPRAELQLECWLDLNELFGKTVE